MRACRVRCFACALVLSAIPTLAATDAQAPPAFSDTTEVTAIQIPVEVLAGGQPVRGLTAADFTVYEGRHKSPVVGFDTVDLQALPAGAEVPGAARRYFLMVFDMANSDLGGIARARGAAIGMLPELHPSDVVAVATYRRTNGIDLVLGFTSDREQVRAALDSLGMPEMIGRAADPLKLIVVEHDNDLGELENLGGNGPAGPQRERRIKPPPTSIPNNDGTISTANPISAPLDASFHSEQEQKALDRESEKAEIEALTSSLSELARLMRSISGRKEVLLFSEGFDMTVVQGSTDQEERDQMYEEGSELGAVWRVDAEQRYGSSGAAVVIERMLTELRQADCRVHTIDVSGLRSAQDRASGGSGRDSLFQIAHDTGGELYENFNDLSAAVGKMLERTGVTYVLTIQPEDLKKDGAYHELRVELAHGKAPRGARVIARPGYYAPRPFAERGKLDRTVLTGSRLLTGDDAGPVRTAVLAAPYPQDGAPGGVVSVPVLIEVDGPALMADNGDGDLLAEIYVYAFDDQGGIRDYLAQALSLELAKVEPELRQGGLHFLGHLKLPPGHFALRVLALNGRTGAYGLRTAQVDVPGAGQPLLLPPLFPQPPGRGVVTREAAADGQEIPFPFTHGSISYVPDLHPILHNGQEAPVALVGYRFPEASLQVRTEVLAADGHAMSPGGSALRVLDRESGSADGSDRLRAAFRPAQLAPGDYVLRVTVSGGGASQESSAPFTIAAGPGGS